LKFKVGDRVITNPKFDGEMMSCGWWWKYNNQIMTIMEIACGSCSVKENTYSWSLKWLLLYDGDFIKENEFNV